MLANTKHTKTPLLILLLAVIIVTAIVLAAIYRQQNPPVEQVSDSYLDPQYISPYQEEIPDLATEVLLDKETTYAQDPVVEAKQGEIVVDPERNVVNLVNPLTPEQIQQYEQEYKVDFTTDQTAGGVYVVYTTSESDLAALTSATNAVTEVDAPVQLLADTVDWGVTRTGADQVWTRANGAGVIVAVVDTGTQLDHIDLAASVTGGYDFVNNDISAYDDNGHGTHVSGIVVASSNSVGTVGVSPAAKVMPVKVLNAQGYGYLSDVAKGIYYAVDNGARVVNLSLGSTSTSTVLQEAVRYAARRGVLVVGAAGNAGGQPCVYPAAYDEVICVMATDLDNKLASFSNVGGELSAPGVSNYAPYPVNRYAYLSGTSMASPHVAGVAALLFQQCPECSSSDIRQLLHNTAVDLGTTGYDKMFGYGLVDAIAATTRLGQATQPDSTSTAASTTTSAEPAQSSSTSTSDKRGGNSPATSSSAARPVAQDLVLMSPELGTSKRLEWNEQKDLELKFRVQPKSDNSSLVQIAVYLDNKEVYASTQQEGEYVIRYSQLTSAQYIVRITATYRDRGQQNVTFNLDMTKSKGKQAISKASPIDETMRRVLGIARGFKY